MNRWYLFCYCVCVCLTGDRVCCQSEWFHCVQWSTLNKTSRSVYSLLYILVCSHVITQSVYSCHLSIVLTVYCALRSRSHKTCRNCLIQSVVLREVAEGATCDVVSSWARYIRSGFVWSPSTESIDLLLTTQVAVCLCVCVPWPGLAWPGCSAVVCHLS